MRPTREDPLAPARGVLIGIVCGIAIWILVIVSVYVLSGSP